MDATPNNNPATNNAAYPFPTQEEHDFFRHFLETYKDLLLGREVEPPKVVVKQPHFKPRRGSHNDRDLVIEVSPLFGHSTIPFKIHSNKVMGARYFRDQIEKLLPTIQAHGKIIVHAPPNWDRMALGCMVDYWYRGNYTNTLSMRAIDKYGTFLLAAMTNTLPDPNRDASIPRPWTTPRFLLRLHLSIFCLSQEIEDPNMQFTVLQNIDEMVAKPKACPMWFYALKTLYGDLQYLRGLDPVMIVLLRGAVRNEGVWAGRKEFREAFKVHDGRFAREFAMAKGMILDEVPTL